MTLLESDVATAVRGWLVEQSWDVSSEVCLDRALRDRHYLGDARADHVATRGQQLAVVECKLHLSFELFAQGKRWLPFADLVWLAVPVAVLTDARREALSIARVYYGVGILECGDEGVVERVRPTPHRRRDDALLVSLDEGHKTHAAAGTNQGGQWSVFKGTAEKLAQHVAKHPQCTLEEALETTGHHYRTKAQAVDCLRKAIRKGLVPGVQFGWRQRLEPVEMTEKSGETG